MCFLQIAGILFWIISIKQIAEISSCGVGLPLLAPGLHLHHSPLQSCNLLQATIIVIFLYLD